MPRTVGVILAVLACLELPAARAAEPDRWADEDPEQRERMAHLAEAEVLGRLEPEVQHELDRYWATHLRRGDLNALESAVYSAAEIHLRRRNPKAAVATLEKLLRAEPRDETRDLTHLNLAEICRRQLNDFDQAAEHYRRVGGPQRHVARFYLLRMLADTGKPDDVAKSLEGFADDAKDKGEKLALLHRLARHYKQRGKPDQALAVYERIAAQFTPKDIDAMRRAAAAEAQALLKKIIQLREDDRWDHGARLEDQMHRRARELELAGRWDEARAFRQVLDDGVRLLRRQEEELERRERQERQRDREPEEAERRERGDPDEKRRGPDF